MSFKFFLIFFYLFTPVIETDSAWYEKVVKEIVSKSNLDFSEPSDASFLIKYLMQFPFIDYVEIYRIDENPVLLCRTKLILKKIKFYGLKGWEREYLLARISAKKGEYYSEEEIQMLKGEIEELLQKDGYKSTRVELKTEKEKDGVEISVILKDGERDLIDEVFFDGDEEYAGSFMKLKGKEFSVFYIEDMIRAFREEMRKKGFLDVDIEWERPDTGKLKISLRTGKRYTFKSASRIFLHSDFKKIAMKVYEERGFIDTEKIIEEVRKLLARRELDRSSIKIKIEEWEDEVIYTLYVFEEKGLLIRKIKFEGARSIGEKELKGVMKLKEARWFKRIFDDENGIFVKEWVRDDLSSIERLYRMHSFLDAKARLKRIVEGSRGYELFIEINEGKKYIVDEVYISEDLKALLGKSLKAPRLPAGVGEMDGFIKNLHEGLKGKGIMKAEILVVEYPLYETGNEVHLKYFISLKGDIKEYGTGNIFFFGWKRARTSFLRNLTSDMEGSSFTQDTRVELYRRLSGVDYFRDVEIIPLEKPGEKKVDLAVNLTEKPPRRFSFGIGYATEEGARAFTSIGFTDLFGEGFDIILYGRVASWIKNVTPAEVWFSRENYELSVLEGRVDFNKKVLFHRRFFGGVIVDYKYLNRPSFEIRFLELSLLGRAELMKTSYITGGYTFRRREPIEIPPDLAEENRFTILGFFSVGLLLDRRDNPVLPARGWIMEIKNDVALRALGSESDYMKLSVRGKEYFPITDFLNLRVVNRFGYGKNFTEEFKIPVEERFFLGGSNSIRGFEEDSVGPVDPVSGKCIGGNFMLNYGIELSLKMNSRLSFAVFFEGGGVFEDISQFGIDELDKLREGAGFGIRWSTPVGEIAGDMGFKLDRRRDEKINVFHFSVGRFL